MFIKKGIKGMLSGIRDLIPVIAFALLILVNLARIRLFVIGVVVSVAYIAIVGYYIGKVFLVEEEEKFVRWMFGIFLVLSLFIFVGTPIVVLYKLDVLSLAVVLSAPLVLLSVRMKLQRGKLAEYRNRAENAGRIPYFSLVYFFFIVLIAYCAFLLVKARSGWLYGTVWSIISPSFFPTYFLATFVLIGIVLYSRTKTVSKMLLTVMYSLISTMILAIVLYPGVGGDPLDNMGLARMMFDYGNLRYGLALSPFHTYWMLKEKALALLTAMVAKMFVVDVYWIHTFITPFLWGVFVPLTAYKIAKIVGGGERLSILAALLTTFYSGFTGWSSRSTGNGLGYVMFFVSLYFSLRYLKSEKKTMALLLAGLSVVVSMLVHPMTGIMSLVFLFLANSLKIYEVMKLKRLLKARFLMFATLVICVFTIPAFFSLNNMIYLYFAPQYASEVGTAFSVGKLLSTDIWELIFGYFVNFSFKEVVLVVTTPLLGMLGLAYAFKDKDKHERILVWFMFLAFLIVMINYRMLQYAMVAVLFGPGRLLTFSDLMAIPFVALAINSSIKFLEGGAPKNPTSTVFVFKKWTVKTSARKIFVLVLISLSLSAFAVSSIERGYAWFRGGHPTALEVEAVKYIDEHTDERYVVVSMPSTTQVGWGFVGLQNPEKFYIYDRYLGQNPTVADMVQSMKQYQAGVGYFITSTFGTPNFDQVFAQASRDFGLVKILGNEKGSIYIFKYKFPPLPLNHPDPNADVMPFYWDTPPSYYVQNGLMRVIFNPQTKTLDVRDFWGDLYESINLNETFVNEKPLGIWSSIEYYEPSNNTWANWDPLKDISFSSALALRFEFRLRFESGSLIGVVEKGKPSVQLWWEGAHASTLSLEVGDFSRLYIPGLVGGIESYNVRSREFGLLYTLSRTSNVVLHPAYRVELNTAFLTFDQIMSYCNLTTTQGYLSYDLYVHNNAEMGQWAYIETWLPDKVYLGTPPPLSYSLDGGITWSGSLIYTDFPRGIPIKTLTETEVNWVFTWPGKATEIPDVWRAFTVAAGGPPILPENFTDSGGGQNRILFGLYLPAGDKALVRLGVSIYYIPRPLKITYVFTDSDHISYGLFNMKSNSIKLYNFASSSFVGGWNSTQRPSSLRITGCATGKIESASITFPAETIFYIYAAKGVDTTIDENGDGIPDRI